MKKCLATFAFLLALCLPAAAFAQTDETAPSDDSLTDESQYIPDGEYDYYDEDYYNPADYLRSGFSISFNVGPDFVPKDVVNPTHTFDFSAIGGNMNLNIGYKTKYVGFYLDLFLRSGWAMRDVEDNVTIRSFDSTDGKEHSFSYNLVDKGDWDGNIGGVGLMFMGFIPFSDTLAVDLGLGFNWALGPGVFHDTLQHDFEAKFRVGFDIPFSYNLMLGMAVEGEVSFIYTSVHISPVFSLVYTY